jgi:peptidyl-prolyl cis-trans isomerase C
MSYRISLIILLSLLAAGTVISCGRESKVLARVGDQQITLAEFEEAYRPMPGLADSAALQENKAKFLDQMVEQRLLVLAALEKGTGQDPQLLERFEDMKKNILLGQLYKIEIVDKAKPTESEIRSFYKKLGTEVKASHILVKTEAEAKDLVAKLKSGASFEELARQHSQDPGSAQQGGSLGWFGWGRMVDDFQRAAFALKPGQVSDPVETSFGFHIIKLDSTRPAELQPLEQMRERITQQLSQTKPRELTTKYLKALQKQAGIKIQEKSLSAIAAKQQPVVPGMPPVLPQLSSEELKMVLVKYNGGSWTVGQFFEQAKKLMNGMVDLNNRPMFEKQVDALLTNEFLLKRAKARGLDRQPQVKRQMERAWNDLLAGAVYREQVQPKCEVDENEAQEYYRKNKKEFYQAPRALMHIIVVKTRPEAEEVYRLLSQGADFATLARERSIDWTKSTGGALQMLNPKDTDNPEAAARAFAMPLNQISRPFACRDGFAVMKVSKREPGAQRTYEQTRNEILSRLRQSKEEAAFQELISALRQKYNVTIDQALLAKAGNGKQ